MRSAHHGARHTSLHAADPCACWEQPAHLSAGRRSCRTRRRRRRNRICTFNSLGLPPGGCRRRIEGAGLVSALSGGRARLRAVGHRTRRSCRIFGACCYDRYSCGRHAGARFSKRRQAAAEWQTWVDAAICGTVADKTSLADELSRRWRVDEISECRYSWRGSNDVRGRYHGARAVLAGRAYAYGLGAAGEAGVARAVEILRADLVRTLKLLGCAAIAELDQSYIDVPADWPRE